LKNKNLIIAPVGDFSYHPNWVNSPKRNFDLILVYFGSHPNRYRFDADYYFEKKGFFKFENVRWIVETFPDIIKGYDTFWFPDNDIMADPRSIDQMFEIFNQHKLDLAQPAISIDSHINWGITVESPSSEIRYVNFIENMCPLFNKDSLFQVLNTFSMVRSGWGLDFLWSKMLEGKNLAIIDNVVVRHKSNLKSGKWLGENCRRAQTSVNVNAFQDWYMIMEKYQIKANFKEFRRIKKPLINRFKSNIGFMKRLVLNPILLIRLILLYVRESIKWRFPTISHG